MSDVPIETNDNVVSQNDDLASEASCAADGSVGRAQRARAVGGRFTPGQSGNPGGRPRKQPEPLAAMMRRVLNETIQFNRDGKRIEMSFAEAMFRSMCRKGMADARVGKEVFKLVAVHEVVADADKAAADPAQSEAAYRNHLARMRRQILAELSLSGASDTGVSDNDNPRPSSDPDRAP